MVNLRKTLTRCKTTVLSSRMSRQLGNGTPEYAESCPGIVKNNNSRMLITNNIEVHIYKTFFWYN